MSRARLAEKYRPPNAYTDIPLGQPFVVIEDRAVRYNPAKLKGKHRPGVYVDESGIEHKVEYFELTNEESYLLSRGTTMEDLAARMTIADTGEAKRVPVRDITERVERVRDTYSFCVKQEHEAWLECIAAEQGEGKHELIAMLTERGWRSVSCTCEAFEYYDEICVHCVALDEWLQETTNMTTDLVRNGNQIVKSEPAALVARRERQSEFYAVVNDIYFQGKGTPALLDFVAVYCERNELDIFAGHVYVIERRSKDKQGNWKSTWSVMTGIHGYLAQADRTGEYSGVTGKQWCDADGKWYDIWLKKEPPAGARITVHRKGRLPVEGIATWETKVQVKEVYENSRPTGRFEPQGLWASDGPGQLMKCALSQALRQQFPNNARFRSDSIASITTDAPEGNEHEGERIVVDPNHQLTDEQQRRLQSLQSSPGEDVYDADFSDHEEETQPDFAAQKRLELRDTVIANLNSHPHKNEWVKVYRARYGDTKFNLDYGTLADINAELLKGVAPMSDVPTLTPEEKAAIEAREAEAAAQSAQQEEDLFAEHAAAVAN